MAKKYDEPLHIVEQKEDGVHWGVKKCNRDTGHYAWITPKGYENREDAEWLAKRQNRVTPDG